MKSIMRYMCAGGGLFGKHGGRDETGMMVLAFMVFLSVAWIM